jgi:hypothetical protein
MLGQVGDFFQQIGSEGAADASCDISCQTPFLLMTITVLHLHNLFLLLCELVILHQ